MILKRNVLSFILFNATMDKTVNKVIGVNRKPDMKILIFAYDVLLWVKDEKEIEGN
jgi:hypothetical protein